MKTILTYLAYLGLALLVLTPILYWQELITEATNKQLLLIGTLVWLGAYGWHSYQSG